MHTSFFPEFDLEPPGSGQNAKTLGAFYTDSQIADFLVWWAVRASTDTVMDPSFGGGVFLRSACKRLVQLGGQIPFQVRGVEIEPEVHRRIAEKLEDEFSVPAANLRLGDFFCLETSEAEKVDAVVGNPPFIRYQRFPGAARRSALGCSTRQGVHLPELCSSWAPFVVHGTAMLKAGGRLAMVLPMELAHARYALPVLEYLRASFGKVIFLTFRKKLFPDLSENTLLLLAEGKGASTASFFLRDLSHAGDLAAIQIQKRHAHAGASRIEALPITQGQERLVEYLVPKKARALYRELRQLPQARRLGELADIGIGYVTGANDFFHLLAVDVLQWRIPKRFLRPAVRKGKALTGLRFTYEDWRQAMTHKEAGYLLHIKSDIDLPDEVRRYLEHGSRQGVAKAYKCRTRSPWYCVPHVHQPDAFLTYMSGVTPRLVVNDAGVVASNALHLVRLHPAVSLSPAALSVLWQTSLVKLSVEIQGHALGGGMLKLEPTEAENVLVPLPSLNRKDDSIICLAEELDELAREGKQQTVRERVDEVVLQKGLGLTSADCRLLQRAADTLRARRYARSVSA